MASGGKRVREEEPEEDVGPATKKNPDEKENNVLIYIMKNKLSSGHFNHLKQLAVRNGFTVSNTFSDDVTHIVTAVLSHDRVESITQRSIPNNVEVVSTEWLTTSFIEGKLIQVTDRYRLKKVLRQTEPDDSQTPARTSQQELLSASVTEYECQRPTLLEHPNGNITEALELLERYYQHLDHKQGDTRALAFRQASCTIKALPRKVLKPEEVTDLHRIGKHSMRVIKEIIEDGSSQEVEEIRNSDWFKCMELFTSIYGCGSATADKWYKKGLRTIEDIRQSKELDLTEIQKLGIKYHEEISQLIPRSEVEYITEYIRNEVKICCPGATVEAVGGYRRGKSHSHDVDLLLSHEDVIVQSLLETVIHHMKTKGIIIHADVSIGQNTPTQVHGTHDISAHSTYTPQGKQRRVKFDHLDKAFCILKLKQKTDYQSKEIGGKFDMICRVDLIVTPPKQYPFAVVSWTGSKQFNRSLRRYSLRECQKTVTAHGIFDMLERKFLPAKTEKDVFHILNLKYFEPYERNC